MRRWIPGLVLAGALLVAPPAAAQEDVVVDGIGWYSSLTLEVSGMPLGDPLANATLEQHDVPVAAGGTDEHKRSYLDLAIPEGATGAVIELPLSETELANFGVPGPILACPVAEPLFVQRSGDLEAAPEIDCGDDPVVGEPNADLLEGETATGFIFDLGPILARWNAGEPANGIALVADVREPQPLFQITFRADIFDSVGTATGGSAVEADSPPPDLGAGPAEGSEAPALDGGFPPEPPAASGSFRPDQDQAMPSTEVPEPESAGPQPSAAPPDTSPAAAGPPLDPPPVNPLAWLLALPLCAALLFGSGRTLAAAGSQRSTLDRLLDK